MRKVPEYSYYSYNYGEYGRYKVGCNSTTDIEENGLFSGNYNRTNWFIKIRKKSQFHDSQEDIFKFTQDNYDN